MSRVFIVEGIDGSGKTTICKKLKEWIESKYPNYPCSIHREPGGTPSGEYIREIINQVRLIPKHQLVMFFTSRYFLCEYIKNNPNEYFIIDRFVPSTYAYQHYGLGVDEEQITELHKIICPSAFNIMNYSTIIYLKTNPNKAIERIQKRNEPLSIFENIEFLTKVSDGYDQMFKKTINDSGNNLIIVNTSNRNEDEVWNEVKDKLESNSLE